MKSIAQWGRAVLVAGLGFSSVAASAQWMTFPKAEDAVAYRKGAFKVMEHHFSRLSAMALKRIPWDQAQAVEDANVVMVMARLPFHGFVPGSGAPLVNTRANEFVWTARPRFDASAQQLREKVDKLPAAARAGDLDVLKKLVIDAGSTCRKCHDQFRNR